MDWLNYHHLFYFWVVATEGSVAKASARLRLAQPTLSGQIRRLEEQFGAKLFQRAGRGLALTELGKTVFEYSTNIFTLGRELTAVLQGRSPSRPGRLQIGIADSVPKLVAYRLLEPILRLPEPVPFVCLEDHADQLIALLARDELDMILSDSPLNPGARIKAYDHRLGASPVAWFGAPRLLRHYRRRLPHSLQDAPVLLPLAGTPLRRSLDLWFDSQNLVPRIVGEFKDSALLKAFGEAAAGLFAAPVAIERELHAHYGVRPLLVLNGITEQYFAITAERRLRHPAVLAVWHTARQELLPSPARRST